MNRIILRHGFRLIVFLSLLVFFIHVHNKKHRPTIDEDTIAASIPSYPSQQQCHSFFSYMSKSFEKRCYPLLVNFAQGCCEKAQQENCRTGLKFGVQQCIKFNREILDENPTFTHRNQDILKHKRGAGYWLWKPYLILRELYMAREGDVIIYSDALVAIVANISHLTELTKVQDVLVFELSGWKESVWTKRDAFILLDVDRPEYVNSSAALASYIVVRKSFNSIAFVSEWLAYAQDSRLITDSENTFGFENYPNFRHHRHDQTILSLLAKKWKLKLFPDPSQWGESETRPYPTIFDHHRDEKLSLFDRFRRSLNIDK